MEREFHELIIIDEITSYALHSSCIIENQIYSNVKLDRWIISDHYNREQNHCQWLI